MNINLGITEIVIIFIAVINAWIAFQIYGLTKKHYGKIENREKEEYEYFIIDRIYDLKAVASWLTSYLDGKLAFSETYPERINERLIFLEDSKRINPIVSKIEIDFFINMYRLAQAIFEEKPYLTNEIKISYLNSFLKDLKKLLEDYDEFLD